MESQAKEDERSKSVKEREEKEREERRKEFDEEIEEGDVLKDVDEFEEAGDEEEGNLDEVVKKVCGVLVTDPSIPSFDLGIAMTQDAATAGTSKNTEIQQEKDEGQASNIGQRIKRHDRRSKQKRRSCIYPTDNKTALSKIAAAIVDVDTYQAISSVGEEKQPPKLKKNRKSYPHGGEVTEEVWNKLTNIYLKDGGWGTVWKCAVKSYQVVLVADIIDIISNNFIDAIVVSGFITMIEKCGWFDSDAVYIMPTTCWTQCTESNGEGEADTEITRLFVENGINKAKICLFPMCSPGAKSKNVKPNHWTLMTYDGGSDGRWWFYNSFIRRPDLYKADAQRMKDIIETGARMIQPQLDKKKKALEIVRFAPKIQQQEENDCAFHVMDNIIRVVKGLPTESVRTNMKRFKGRLIEMFVNNDENVNLYE